MFPATDVPGLFRVDVPPDRPVAVVARRGGGRARVIVRPFEDVDPVYQDLIGQLRAAGLPPGRPRRDLRAGPDLNVVLAQTNPVLEATLLPQSPGKVRVLHAHTRGVRTVVVFAVQAPSGGWVVVPTELEATGSSSWRPLVDGVAVTPSGDPGTRAFAWRSYWIRGHLQVAARTSDIVAVLGPPGARTAWVSGANGEDSLALTDGYGEAEVSGARHVRFLDASGTVLRETDVAALLPPNRHIGAS